MSVHNVHQRDLPSDLPAAGVLIDSLASPSDALWPSHSWPRMALDGPLREGSAGGHGPIRYYVEKYVPGRAVRFRFTRPRGFEGVHGYELLESGASGLVLRHTLEMKLRGFAWLSWPLVFEPLHDALIEDSLTSAQHALAQRASVRPWSPWVKFLRWVMTCGRSRPQWLPERR